MGECNRCHDREGIHRWGKYILCDECHNEFSKITQSPNKVPEVLISQETEQRRYAFYRNGDAEIWLLDDGVIEETLNHEYMHHVLNVRFNPQTSFNYDNIYEEIDSYHSFE